MAEAGGSLLPYRGADAALGVGRAPYGMLELQLEHAISMATRAMITVHVTVPDLCGFMPRPC
jgi:hypothetical protein